ncbi:uncharacterized protein [Hoplias malabaricus]|uniref:uncharacterized protein n=1 Tax=Hoplias malabaricus TaxID=27720 RepID=UPI0034624BF9
MDIAEMETSKHNVKASMKRSPSPSEHRRRKKRLQSENEYGDDDEAEGRNSLESTANHHPATVGFSQTTNDHSATVGFSLTKNDHPATVSFSLTTNDHPATVGFSEPNNHHPATVDEIKIEVRGHLKVPLEDWNGPDLIKYWNSDIIYPDLSNRKQLILYILHVMNRFYSNCNFVVQTESNFSTGIRDIFFMQYRKIYSTKSKGLIVKLKNQFAFYYFRKKDGNFTEPFGPYFPEDGGKIHSEDLIITEIEKLIQNNYITYYTELWIYSVNSPCLARKNSHPCMMNITGLSCMLGSDYGIKTNIIFSKYYGASGSISKCLPPYSYKNSDYNKEPPMNFKIEDHKKTTCIFKTYPSLWAITPDNKHNLDVTTNNLQDFKCCPKLLPLNYDQHMELARNRIIRETDLQSEFIMKTSNSFKKNEIINSVKKKISKDNWKSVINTILKFNPKFPESPHTFEDHKKIGIITSEEIEASLRALISEEFDQSVCKYISDTFKSEFLKWWNSNLENRYTEVLNERLSNGINRETVHIFIENIKNLPYRPNIYWTDITEIHFSDNTTPSDNLCHEI